MTKKIAIGEAFGVTKTLASLLEEVSIGETISYQRLSEAISMDVQNGAYGYRASAQNFLRREYGIVFDVQRGIGLIRVGGPGKTDVAESKIRRGVSAFGRAKRTLATVGRAEYQAMTNRQKAEWNSTTAVVGLMEITASAKVRRKIEKKATELHDVPSLDDALKALTEKKT